MLEKLQKIFEPEFFPATKDDLFEYAMSPFCDDVTLEVFDFLCRLDDNDYKYQNVNELV